MLKIVELSVIEIDSIQGASDAKDAGRAVGQAIEDAAEAVAKAARDAYDWIASHF